MFSEFDRLAMTRALALAERGLETTHPNPRVGCVIARDNRIIAEGWHERAGEAHAEVAALRSAKEPVAGATAYVTLEPCSHHGRTPPCVNGLIEARLARVVFAVQDPNPRVSGQGADALLRAGILVEAGLMEAEATELNIGFMKRMKQGLPWVRVKLAMSLDGRTALANGASQWITSEHARNDVQRWRARCSAVMTGVGTVLADDPMLNVRVAGFKGRQPLRVVLDARLRSPVSAKMFVGLGVDASGTGEAAGAAAARAGGATEIGTDAPAALAGDVLIFTAVGGGALAASPARAAVIADPNMLAGDMADLVNAFETSPAAVAARSADPVGHGSAPPTVAAAAIVSGAAAPADDATWAGAALSGAIPVKSDAKGTQSAPMAPAGTSAARLSADGTATGMSPTPTAPTPTPAGVAAQASPAAVAPASGVTTVGAPTGAVTAAAAPTGGVAAASAPIGRVAAASAATPAVGTRAHSMASGSDSPAAFQARGAALAARGVRIEEVAADDGFLDLFAVLQKLAGMDVNEVLVEAGPTLAGQLLSTFFVDELLLYIAPKLLGPQGRPLVNLPELQSLQDAWGFSLFDAKRFGDDLRLRLRPK